MCTLFEQPGPRGGARNVPAYGCWCMFWRDRSLEHGEPKKRAMGKLVRAGSEPGLLAYDGDEPVSIGRLYTHPQSAFAGLYGGGTLATRRGRGFYRAVLATRARDAIAAGAQYLRVDALPTSFPILQRLGFVEISASWPCEWKP